MCKTNGISRHQFVASVVSTAVLAAVPVRSIAGATMQKTRREEMTTLTPYLLFDGNCRPAMEFYRSCFGGELSVTEVKDTPAKDHLPAVLHGRIINARLRSGNLELSASDWLRPDRTPIRGNTVCLYLSGGTLRQMKALFGRLSEGAEVTDPVEERFFGTYGALNDRFGVRWMFQTDQKA